MSETSNMIFKVRYILDDPAYTDGVTIKQLTELLIGDDKSAEEKTRNIVLGIVNKIRTGKLPELSATKGEANVIRISKTSAYDQLRRRAEQFRRDYQAAIDAASSQLSDDERRQLTQLANSIQV